MIFESHAHYEDKQFDADRELLLRNLLKAGVKKVVNVGSSIETTKASFELANTYTGIEYPEIYVAAGVHPSDTAELDEEKMDYLKTCMTLPECVAVGEIGLDYYWDKEAEVQANQRYWFRRQLELAKQCQKPVIIHSRDAAKDTMDIMREEAAGKLEGVIHCFSNSLEFAKLYVDMGFYIGIGGVVTFKNAKTMKEVAEWTPLDRILLETDCPYLAPVPNRGKRNSSLNLKYVAEEIARIKGISCEAVIEATWDNAMRMYGIKS